MEMQILKRPKRVVRIHSGIRLIRELLSQLDSEEIGYVHWKSNWKIQRWLDGEGDLDLLVRRDDIGKFSCVLGRLGFKKALTTSQSEIPGILNFYGFDPETQKIVHIHAHYQLVFGHDLTKNYRLPIESTLISSATRRKGLLITAVELELILFVIRMVLKHSTLEGALRRAVGKADPHYQAISDELDYLESRADASKVSDTLRSHFPMIDRALFDYCLKSLRLGANVPQKLLATRRLKKSLSAYSRMSMPVEAMAMLKGRLMLLVNKLAMRKASGKTFENGGVVVAIVGGDGSGKTTCVEALYTWLRKTFDTRRVHLGKPPKSIITIIVAAAFKIVKKISRQSTQLGASGDIAIATFFEHLRWTCTARDRYRLYRKISRLAASGTVVICDRYPLENIRIMDNARITASSLVGRAEKHVSFLRRLESSYYRKILPPDLTLVLRVEPSIAVERKTDESRMHVFSRSKALWELDWQHVMRTRLIDAGRPIDHVLAEMRGWIWRAL